MGAVQSVPGCEGKPWMCNVVNSEGMDDAGQPCAVVEPEQAEVAKLCFNAARGRVDAVRLILQQGVARAGDVDYDRRSPLHIAASEGHLPVVELLLSYGATVNAKDRRGFTPLDEAVHGGHVAVRTALSAAGGVTGRGDAELTTHSASAASKVSDCSAVTANMSSALSLGCAAAAGVVSLLQELHAGGADLDAVDYDGRSALHVAAARGHIDVVKWLISMNVNVNRKDNFGRTAVSEAQRMRHETVVEVLVTEGGAKPESALAEQPPQSSDTAWGIPMSEISLGNELSSTLKSVVFRATWRGTPVVCKTARMLPAGTDDGMATTGSVSAAEKELIREIQLLSTIRHPDLVLFLGACVEHSPAFVITEFMEGGDLERYYRSRSAQSNAPYRPPGRKLLRWSSSVARALAFLHEASRPIIHRDLKPLNLLLNNSEELKVTDFGISKLLETNLPGRQRMSGGVGTWRYMAPEVVRCEDYTDRVDVYSYALVLWFMATGQQPYVAELGKDAEEVLRQFIQGNEPRPDTRTMKCPAALRTLTEDCWKVAAAERPSALECTSRLAAIMASYREGPMEVLKQRLSS